jgi:SAM-dependent methyltransferase
MVKHKKPATNAPSDYLNYAWESGYLPLAKNIRCLDLPCGFGRNAAYLSSKYETVVACDYDPDVLSDNWASKFENVFPVLLDARVELPFQDQSFDLITVIHFYDDGLLSQMHRLLKNKGVLIFESIGNRGQNWRQLPRRDEFEEAINNDFELISYEQTVIKKAPEYSTVKLIARKKQ